MTLEETFLGFAIGAVGGIVAGIILGRNKLLADVFSIYIKIANSVPRVVLGSVFIIALGLGMASKVALAVVMVFFVVFANAFQGVREAAVPGDVDLVVAAVAADPERPPEPLPEAEPALLDELAREDQRPAGSGRVSSLMSHNWTEVSRPRAMRASCGRRILLWLSGS